MRCWGAQCSTASSVTERLPIRRRDHPVPPQPVVVSGIIGAVAITTGAYHTCAVLSDRTVQCWGLNDQGQLGDGTMHEFVHPRDGRAASPLPSPSVAEAAHTCALLTRRHGAVLGRQRVRAARRRDGARRVSRLCRWPESAMPLPSAAGWRHTCALLGDGTARCWGQNEFGQLGNGTTDELGRPRCRSAESPGPSRLTGGWWHHSCALLGDGSVRCWGMNEWGQLGNGTTSTSPFHASRP